MVGDGQERVDRPVYDDDGEMIIWPTEDREIDKADRIYYDIDNFAKDISFLSNDLPTYILDLQLRYKRK